MVSPFKGHRELLERREREELSVQLDQWVFLEARAPLVEMVPQEEGVCRVISDHRDDKDLPDPSEPQERPEPQDLEVQRVLQEIKDFLVLLVPKAIREREVMCSPKLLCVPSLGKCVNSSSRATCPAITPY